MHAEGRAHTGSFALRVFMCFLKMGILGEVLNRILVSFPGLSFDMSMHQNKHIEGPGSFSG